VCQFARDAWNSRDPERVSKAYTLDSDWRNRTEFFTGREAIKEFLTRKWAKEQGYRLMKELWYGPRVNPTPSRISPQRLRVCHTGAVYCMA